MATKNINTQVDEEVFERFKNCCKNDYGVSLAIVTEALMKDFCDGGYDVIISKNGTSLRRHEDENDKKAN